MFHEAVCKVLYLLLLVFLPSVAMAQEDVRRVAGDSLRTGTAGEAGIEFVSSDVGFVLPDKEAVCPSDGRLPVSDSLFHLSLKKPLVETVSEVDAAALVVEPVADVGPAEAQRHNPPGSPTPQPQSAAAPAFAQPPPSAHNPAVLPDH